MPWLRREWEVRNALTVKGLLAIPLTNVCATDHRFCRTPHCPVVHYTANGDRGFLEDDVRERVYQNPNEDGVFVCYCFRHSIGSIRNELAGRPHDFRERRNPQ